MSEREKLLKTLSAYQFAAWETGLFLDTHPCDRMAMAYYERVRDQKNALMKEYAEAFGPITKEQVRPGEERFTWLESPWPWEGGNC
jgi:spore coat protein JB